MTRAANGSANKDSADKGSVNTDSAGMTRAGMTRAGHTRITQQAIRKTLESVTAQAFRVGAGNVAAELEDDAGKLGVKVSVKLSLPSLLGPRTTTSTVFEQARAARTQLVSRGLELTGLEIGRVDIRLAGAKGQAGSKGQTGTTGKTETKRQAGAKNQPGTTGQIPEQLREGRVQ
ncbi:hypothetical protein V3C41_09075 [Paenarthrobacter nicotinovorans]|uniref:Alkaline shock family protein YloU n=1 Tax=Paenarthrobacter nicotinovorans TaxID=29320 RepID=A0ABV0GS10_PAENI